jgi:hypothetical protein
MVMTQTSTKRWSGLFLLLLCSCATTAARGPSSTISPSPSLATGVVEIANPAQQFSDIYAISDTHGMLDHLVALLTQAGLIDGPKSQNWNAKKSLLVIVGDSIDKGPNSIEVVDLWIKLQAQAAQAGGQVIHLLGNHEAEFLANPSETDNKGTLLVDELASKNLPVSNFTDPTLPHGAFIRQEALAARVGNWLFCHAGLYPTTDWNTFKTQAQALLANASYDDAMITGSNSILEAKDWWQNQSARTSFLANLTNSGMEGVVQGHQPSAYDIQDSIGSIEGGRMIRIDTGMAPDAAASPGMILHFIHPAQLSAPIATQTIPDAVIIYGDGTPTAPLVPMTYDPTKFTPDVSTQ